MTRLSKIIFGLLSFSLLLILWPNLSQALTISPLRIELSTNRGQEVEDVVKIFNETAQPLTLFVSTANFAAKGEGGEPYFISLPEGEEDLANWIEIEKGPITISSLEQKVIPFKVKVPSWAPPGGHFAAIFFSTTAPEMKGGTGVGIIGKIGALVLLRVSGDFKEEGRLVEFSLNDGKEFYEHLPVDFLIRFENTGTIHLKPMGDITIKNLLGGTAAIIEVNKIKAGNVLPESIRRFEASWKEDFAFGRYRADLVLDYGSQNNKAYAALSFWVIPWRPTLIVIVIIAILLTFAYVGLKRYNRWIVSRALKHLH